MSSWVFWCTSHTSQYGEGSCWRWWRIHQRCHTFWQHLWMVYCIFFLHNFFPFFFLFFFLFQSCPNILSCTEQSRYHFVYDANTNIILSSETDVRDIQYILYIIQGDHSITSNQTLVDILYDLNYNFTSKWVGLLIFLLWRSCNSSTCCSLAVLIFNGDPFSSSHALLCYCSSLGLHHVNLPEYLKPWHCEWDTINS